MTTPRLQIPELTSSQANKYVTHNEALQYLDALCQASVKDRVISPPGAPANGNCYLIDASLGTATGDFEGYDDYIAQYYNSDWTFHAPLTGWEVYVEDEDLKYTYDGSSWVPSRTIHDQLQTITPADSVTINWNLGHVAKITLDRASTTINFSGGSEGERLLLKLIQDGTGGREVTLDSDVRYGDELSSASLATGTNEITYYGFIVASGGKYDFVSQAKGFSG